MLSTTISTTSTPSAMQAHEIIPIQFIRRVFSGFPATELSGLGSETLPTLGSETSLDPSLEELEKVPAMLEISLDELEETAVLRVLRDEDRLDALEEDDTFEDDGAFEEDGAEGVDEGGCAEDWESGCDEPEPPPGVISEDDGEPVSVAKT